VAAVLDGLACPVCHGGLRLDDGSIDCVVCRLSYPLVDGIPVLKAGRARKLDA
jgi:uncharacterized protein YbaR (Trm112 family)